MYYFNKGTQFQKGFPKYREILTIDIKIFKKTPNKLRAH